MVTQGQGKLLSKETKITQMRKSYSEKKRQERYSTERQQQAHSLVERRNNSLDQGLKPVWLQPRDSGDEWSLRRVGKEAGSSSSREMIG